MASFSLDSLVQTVWLALFRGLWLASRSSMQLGCCATVLLAEGWQVILCIASVCLVTARLELVLKDGSFSCYSAAGCFATVRQILLWHCGRMFCTERQDVLLYGGKFFCGSATRCFALPWQIGRNVPIVGLLTCWVSSCFGVVLI